MGKIRRKGIKISINRPALAQDSDFLYITAALRLLPDKVGRTGFIRNPLNPSVLKQGHFDFLSTHKAKSFDTAPRRIIYSYNNVENTIEGYVQEEGDLICLYEYRGQYFGTEFLISFSKNSSSYRLIEPVAE